MRSLITFAFDIHFTVCETIKLNEKVVTDFIALHDIADIIALQMTFFVYRADGVDVAPEIERNLARAKHVAWPSCAWQLLNFFPFPVGHPPHPPCTWWRSCF